MRTGIVVTARPGVSDTPMVNGDPFGIDEAARKAAREGRLLSAKVAVAGR